MSATGGLLAVNGDRLGSRWWHLKAGVSREQKHTNGKVQDTVVPVGVIHDIALQ
jgi:hypothetical protein